MEPTPDTFVAEAVRAIKSAWTATGENLPQFAERMGVSYSSLWRILHGQGVRLSTLRRLHQRFVGEEAAAPSRLPLDIRYLGTVNYLRAQAALTAPYLEVRDLAPLSLLLGEPSSGKTTALLLLAAAADPLGPWVRVAAREFGLRLPDLVLGERAHLLAAGPAGQVRSSWARTGQVDPLQFEVEVRAGEAPRVARFGSLRVPSEAAPGRVRYVARGRAGDEAADPPAGAVLARAMRAAGVRGGVPGTSGKMVLAAWAALRGLEGAGLVLVDEGVPAPSIPFLLGEAAAAVGRGAQVVWAASDPGVAAAFADAGGQVVRIRRTARGAVRARP